MPIVPTYQSLTPGSPLYQAHLLALCNNVSTFLTNLNGSAMKNVEIELSKTGQNLDGGSNLLYNVRRFGGVNLSRSSTCSVRDVSGFGAVGDGVTRADLAIQAAIADLPIGGGIVFVPPGTYMIHDTVHLCGTAGTHDNVILVGSGPSTVFKGNGANGLVLVDVDGSPGVHESNAICNIAFDGNASAHVGGNPASCIQVSTTSFDRGLVIEDCWFTNVWNCGIMLGPVCMDVCVKNCIFTEMATGIQVNNSNTIIIDGCTFYSIDGAKANTSSRGVHINGHCFDVIIQDSPFSNITSPNLDASGAEYSLGVYATPVGTQSVISDVIVDGCSILDCGGSGVLLHNDQYGTPPQHPRIENVIVSGTICSANGGSGFWAMRDSENNANQLLRDIQVFGSVMSNNGIDGIRFAQRTTGSWSNRDLSTGDNSTVVGSCCYRNVVRGIYFKGVNLSYWGANDNPLHSIAIFGNFSGDDRARQLGALPSPSAAQSIGIALGMRSGRCVICGNVVAWNNLFEIDDVGISYTPQGNDVSHNIEEGRCVN